MPVHVRASGCGFKPDRVVVEAQIGVQKTRGVRLSPCFDFTRPHLYCSDGVIVIDGVRLHVSKQATRRLVVTPVHVRASGRGFEPDRVVVEAQIGVQKTRGVRLSPCFDFTRPHLYCSDGVIVIDGVRLHVSKQYLALYSPVFSALLFGEFRERGLNEVPVEDVILEEFMEMLHCIYPSHKAITSENVEFLLELGDKFEVQYVMDECEKFLMRTEEIPVVTKLVWADQYGLAKLQDVCIRTFKATTDIKNLKTTEEYKNLSDATKAALLEKILKLM